MATSPTKPKTPANKRTPKPKTERPKLDPVPEIEIPEHESEPGGNANDKLTDRQIIFCNLYVKFWNATKAARLAGYKDPECSGYENRQKPAIQRYIQRRIADKCMGADEVLMRLGQVARAEHSDFWKFFDATLKEVELEEEELEGRLDGELNSRTYQENLNETLRRVTPYLDVQGMVQAGYGHLIKKYKVEHGQIVEVEFYDMMAALTLIGRHHKLFTDKMEVSTDEPITPDDAKPYSSMGRAELNARIASKVKPPRSR